MFSVSTEKRRRNFINGSRNGELASIRRMASVWRIMWHRDSIYTAEAVWDWWKNVRIVTIFCSSSDFFVTSVTAAGKN